MEFSDLGTKQEVFVQNGMPENTARYRQDDLPDIMFC